MEIIGMVIPLYDSKSICKVRRLKFDELYQKTMERMNRIKALGYEVIYIWEKDYQQYLIERIDYAPDLKDFCVML